jgi:hypothetical protein
MGDTVLCSLHETLTIPARFCCRGQFYALSVLAKGRGKFFVRSCYLKSFGLLLDNSKNPVLPGETLLARDVFDDTGLSNMPRKHQTWDANPDLVSDIILWEDYRNDPSLKEIAEKAKRDRTVQSNFWISGNGGAASYAGELAQTGFASKDANSSAPAAKLPVGQQLTAGAVTLLEVASRKGVIRVFVRDWITKHRPETESRVVYLGIFQIKRVTFECEDEE